MASGNFKIKHKSEKYQNVYLYANNLEELWFAKLGEKQKYFKTEKEAAKFIDLKLIEKGENPVNVLVRK